MPTAAKLIGGILLALTALYSSYLFLSVTTSLYATSEFYFVNTIIGFLIGWRSIGRDPGFGRIGSIVSGLRGAFLLAALSTVTYGIWIVILKLEKFYIKDFPGVIISWYNATGDYLELLLEPGVLMALIIGGSISGIGAGLANRYWS